MILKPKIVKDGFRFIIQKENENEQKIFEYNTGSNEDNTISITGATSRNVTEIVIPDEIDGKPVTAIANQAFYSKYDKLEKITVGNNVVI